MKRYLPSKLMVALGLVPPILFMAVTLYAAFQHNPQGEYYDPYAGGVQWGSVIPLGLSNFLVVYVIVFPILYVMEMLWKAEERSLKRKAALVERRDVETSE